MITCVFRRGQTHLALTKVCEQKFPIIATLRFTITLVLTPQIAVNKQ
jgi:hypothetical protein